MSGNLLLNRNLAYFLVKVLPSVGRAKLERGRQFSSLTATNGSLVTADYIKNDFYK